MRPKGVGDMGEQTLSPSVRAALEDLVALDMGSTLGHSVNVFGSLIRGKDNPFDIDCFLDLGDVEFKSDDQLKPFVPLLRIAQKHYGSVDPFIIFSNRLIVRSDCARGWVLARNRAELTAAMRAEGVPLQGVPQVAQMLAALRLQGGVVPQVGQVDEDVQLVVTRESIPRG